jgi:hypothetical protein
MDWTLSQVFFFVEDVEPEEKPEKPENTEKPKA